ncbi:MAG: transporter substrate-binding domain-containing protein [Lachnospiraceae bacterium]|jgi:ABC-type amino acid transport substrate-binding protein|nr:transporter substrate-binding domain-containing protein [Lachnospiraceae bacterium]
MKKLLTVLLAAALMMTMVACGSDEKETSGADSALEKVTIEKLDDLAGKTIGVQLGTTGDEAASEYESQGATVKRFSKGAEAVQALKTGQVDCVVIDSLPAEKFVEANEDLEILQGDFFEEEQYAICMKKESEMLAKFNAALAELKQEGTLESIMKNYIGDEIGKTPYESPANVDRSNGKLVMATNAAFEPWEYYEGDKIVGVDADIAQAIADKLGMELEITDMEFEGIIAAVTSGKADFGAAGMTVNEERLQSVDFTDTYANATQVIIVRK